MMAPAHPIGHGSSGGAGADDLDLAKRLFAMLDLCGAAEAASFDDVDNHLNRIQSAAGTAASIEVPIEFVPQASDLLYRTRTLVSAKVRVDETGLDGIREAVEAGAGELDVTVSDPDPDTVSEIICAAERRSVKITVISDHWNTEDVDTQAKAGSRFICHDLQADKTGQGLVTTLNAIKASEHRIGVKIVGLETFEDARVAYETLSRFMGEPWIWPGTVRIRASNALQDGIIAFLRHQILQRPTGCGVRHMTHTP